MIRKNYILIIILSVFFSCKEKKDSIPPAKSSLLYNGDYTYDFMNRPLSGKIGGRAWGDSCGIAKYDNTLKLYSIYLYSMNFNDVCHPTQIETDRFNYASLDNLYSIEFYITKDTGTFTYPRKDFSQYYQQYGEADFNFTVSATSYSVNKTSVQITKIDTIANIVEGRISACLSCLTDKRDSYVNGNFSATICK